MPAESSKFTRRQAIIGAAGLGGALLLGAGSYELLKDDGGDSATGSADHVLRADVAAVSVSSAAQQVWAYGERVPGPELRLTRNERTRIRLENGLPADTTIHWHGIRLQNEMDGVPGLTQQPVKPGGDFLYSFVPPDAGTYLYHSHVGVQLDRALYGPLVVEDPNESLDYDVDAVVMIDDWLGKNTTPDALLNSFRKMNQGGSGMGQMGMGSGMSGMAMGSGASMMNMGLSDQRLAQMKRAASSGPHRTPDGAVPQLTDAAGLVNAIRAGATDAGDVSYRAHLINGRSPMNPATIVAKPGERVRLRLINAGGDTLYLFHAEGTELTVVAADGNPVRPRRTQGILLGMGERYDVLLTAGREPVRMVAEALGKRAFALAAVGPRGSRASMATVQPPRRVLGQEDLTEQGGTRPVATPDAEHPLVLGWTMPYRWSVADPDGDESDLKARLGSRVRLAMRNETSMPHPMHLHGHSFRVVQSKTYGPLKDTVLVAPGDTLAVDVVADNPGQWMLHCHNAYHLGAGMMRTVVVKS